MRKPKIVKLAIIGAGPKAAAIAAKAAVISRWNGNSPVRFEIDAFDPGDVGGNWTGNSGYTDGIQHICTLIERDLGFPYASRLESQLEALDKPVSAKRSKRPGSVAVEFNTPIARTSDWPGSPIDLMIFRHFSWSAFKVAQNSYHQWVDGGRRPPTHAEFAQYVSWAFGVSDAVHIRARVTQLIPEGNRWIVKVESDGSKEKTFGPYDGVVVTGPGPADPLHGAENFGGKLFTGVDFWTKLQEVRKLLDKQWTSVAVIGGGGTGAAVLSWMAKNNYGHKSIELIGNQATIYSRTDNWFENRLFSGDDLWARLSKENKKSFFDRVNRGVVWSNIVGDLERLSELSITDATVEEIVKINRRDLEVRLKNGKVLTANVVVDATGFDAWYFTKMLPSTFVVPVERRERRDWRESWKDKLGPNLAWKTGSDWPFPKLHVPGLSDRWGPGLGSLMSMGAMSERILGDYI